MCLIVVARGLRPDLPLVVVGNRDEWLARPAEPLAARAEGLVYGRDLQAGGAWFAIRRDGAVCAVTNLREPHSPVGARSRGELPLRALRDPDPAAGARAAIADGAAYSGFQLLVAAPNLGLRGHNRGQLPEPSDPEDPRRSLRAPRAPVWAVCNGLSDHTWPKVQRAIRGVTEVLTTRGADVDALLDVMDDTEPAPDALLPDTGVGVELERALSAIRVVTPSYGSRVTTVTIVGAADVQVVERPLHGGGERVTLRWRR